MDSDEVTIRLWRRAEWDKATSDTPSKGDRVEAIIVLGLRKVSRKWMALRKAEGWHGLEQIPDWCIELEQPKEVP